MSRVFRVPLLGLLILPCLSAGAATQQARSAPQPPSPPAAPAVQAVAANSGSGYSQLQLRDEHGALLAVAYGDGRVTVLVNGEPVPPEQLVRDGELLSIHAEDGDLLWTLRVLPEGSGFVYPADASAPDAAFPFGPGLGLGEAYRIAPFASAGAAPVGWNSLFWSGDGGAPASRRRIGITTEAVSPALAAQLGLQPSEAFLVQGVSAGAPAETAGLQAFDVVVAIDGTTPATTERLREVLAQKNEGETVRLALLRGGQRLELDVGFLLPEPAPGPAAAAFGFRAPRALSDKVSQELAQRREGLEQARRELAEHALRVAAAGGDGAASTDEARAALESALSALSERNALMEAWRREMEQGGDLLVLGADANGELLTVTPTLTTRRSGDERLAALEQRLARLEELLVAALAARGEDAPPPVPARDGAGTSGEDR